MDIEQKRSPELKTTALFVVAAALVFYVLGAAFRAKPIPGGPFISLFGEGIPIAFCLRAFFAGFNGFREMQRMEKFYVMILFILATIISAGALESILEFSFTPYARGPLIGP